MVVLTSLLFEYHVRITRGRLGSADDNETPHDYLVDGRTCSDTIAEGRQGYHEDSRAKVCRSHVS